MEQVILIRYSEIHLKGKNRGYFEKVLKENIKTKIKKFNAKLEIIAGRYVVSDFFESNMNEIIDLLTKTAGVYSVSPCSVVDTDEKLILSMSDSIMSDKIGSFRVSVNRADKTFPMTSTMFASKVGEYLLEHNQNLTVDLHKFKTNLQIDIRENRKTYIFTDEILGINGMPVGTSGQGLLLLSGGIDSPVAGYMMVKRGMKISAIHFESFPYTSLQARDKAIELAKKLFAYNGTTALYVCNIAKLQEEIHKNCHPDFMITLVRRGMLKIAERLALEKGFQCIITGESLSQVASQTIESMTVIGEAITSNLPLLKPLIAFDKQDTIELANKIDTFNISIKPYDDCCTVFLPDRPVIKPKLYKVKGEESKFDLENILNDCYNSIEKIIIEN